MESRSSTRWRAAAALLACTLSLAACAKPRREPPPRYSAVTPDGLQLVSGGPFAQVWVKPGRDLSVYQKVMLDPVELATTRGADREAVAQSDLDQLRYYFRRAVEKEIGARYALVEAPAADVLRLRAKLVDLRFRVKAGELDPTAPLPNLSSYRLTDFVTVIADLRDSQTGERLRLISDREYVSPPVVPGTEPTSAVDFWGRMELAFEAWARKLGLMLEHARDAPRQAEPVGRDSRPDPE